MRNNEDHDNRNSHSDTEQQHPTVESLRFSALKRSRSQTGSFQSDASDLTRSTVVVGSGICSHAKQVDKDERYHGFVKNVAGLILRGMRTNNVAARANCVKT